MLNRLVGKELREQVQGAAGKAEAVHYHGNQCITVRNLERWRFGQHSINHGDNTEFLAECSDQAKVVELTNSDSEAAMMRYLQKVVIDQNHR